MEVDTGAASSLISLATKKQLFPQKELLDSTLVLTIYTGEQMVVVGRMQVKVNYGETNELLFLHVVEGQGSSLMGRERLNEINLNWQELNLVAEIHAKKAKCAFMCDAVEYLGHCIDTDGLMDCTPCHPK